MEQEINRKDYFPSHVGHSIAIQGNIEGSEDLTVDGHIEGNIVLRGHRLTILPSAWIKGNAEAGEIVLKGKMEGNLKASGKVTVSASASLIGDITALRVAIENGAKFKGTIKIIPER